MITCIIIDDEPKARTLLEMVVKQYCPQLEVVALCEDLPTGIKAIKKLKPQLLFLDIELPGHSGLELMDFFNDDEINFSIIFTTAYNEYALQAFRFSAIDYLLKPIQHTQLIDAVERFERQLQQKQVSQLRVLQENVASTEDWDQKRIVVPNAQSLKFIRPVDIVMIKAESAYSELFLSDKTKLLASRNLKHFEEILSPVPFMFRTHKSYIVNIRAVEEYVKSDGGYLKLVGGLEASIATDKVDILMQKLK
ncbi:MAG: hypothetical protein RIS47_2346 [Bacteroidota bacterium]|jgi:two-component system LytT family response regulator